MVITNPNLRQLTMTGHFTNNHTQEINSAFKFIDLFAGVGGIRLGFQQAFKSEASFVKEFRNRDKGNGFG